MNHFSTTVKELILKKELSICYNQSKKTFLLETKDGSFYSSISHSEYEYIYAIEIDNTRSGVYNIVLKKKQLSI